MNKAVILDFDGVLFDTVKEAYAVTMLALGRLQDATKIDWDNPEYVLFKQYRYLINSAWNYLYLIKVIDQYLRDMSLDLDEVYKKEINLAEKFDYNDFEDKYFFCREQLKKNNYQFWLELNTSYPFLTLIQKTMQMCQRNIFIVTTKDRSTVLKLLAVNGIDFNADQIYDRKDYAKSGGKAKIIEDIFAKHSIKKALFIDDSSEHLSGLNAKEGITTMQPSWGYVALNEKTDSLSSIFGKINEFLEVN